VVVQVAATVVLLISSGLLLRSFHELQQVDAGFNAEGVMTMKIDLPSAKYGTIGQTDEKRVQFVNDLVKRLEALPGVESAAVVTATPLSGGPTFIMRVESNVNVTPSSAPVTRYRTITPDYFKVMGIALVQGRFFTPRDAPGGPRVVIVNRAFAKKFFPGVDNPLGQRVEVGLDEPPRWAEIVGVVADVKIDSLEAETPVQAYEPYHEFSFNNVTVVAPCARRSSPSTPGSPCIRSRPWPRSWTTPSASAISPCSWWASSPRWPCSSRASAFTASSPTAWPGAPASSGCACPSGPVGGTSPRWC
jgi:hypothetical protein